MPASGWPTLSASPLTATTALGIAAVDVKVVGQHVAGRRGVAGKRRVAWIDAALGHRIAGVVVGHRHGGIVGAIDGDGHQPGGAVDRGDGEGVGQRLTDPEPLNRGVAVVERIGPDAGRCQRVGAEAVGAGGRRGDGRPGVVRVIDIGGVEIAGRGGRAEAAVVDAARLQHRAGHRAGDDRGIVGAVDGDGDQLCGAADRRDGERIGQGLTDIERLHQRRCCCSACKSRRRPLSAYRCRSDCRSAAV